jgi:membrane-associated phospholipid phosphatase
MATANFAEAADGGAYQLTLEVDGPLLLIGGALAASFFIKDEAPPAHCAPLCDKTDINKFDRWAAGYYDPSWGRVGDIATFSTLLIGPAAVLIHGGLWDGAVDALVIMEAALWASAVQVLTSYAISRPRPRVYGEKAPLDDRDDANAARSFYSGHVANVMASTVATAITFHRLNEPVYAWTALGVGTVGTAMVGIGRIGAGSHFLSDVLVGAGIGVGLGILIPALHEAPVKLSPVSYEDGGKGVVLAGEF